MIKEIEFGINCDEIQNGRSGPSTYLFRADAINNIVGGYGISGDYPLRAFVPVELPDWIQPSAKYRWDLAIPGRNSKSGTADMCFVVCNYTATEECEYYGSLNGKALIERAISSGLYLIYPDETGEMQDIPVEVCGEYRYIEG